MKISEVFKRVVCMFGSEERYNIADEKIRLFERAENLEYLKAKLRNVMPGFCLEIRIIPIIDSGDNYRIRIEPNDSYHFVLDCDVTKQQLDNRASVDRVIENLTYDIKREAFRGEVHDAQCEMLEHLNANWPEVVADLVLADLYHPPVDDRSDDEK